MEGFMEQAKTFLAEKVGNIKAPEASLTDVDLKDVNLGSVEYLGKVSVDNPYDYSIPICEIHYSIKSADRVIASGKISDPGSIKANEKTMLEVPAKVPHGVLVSLAKDIGADWDIDYEMCVDLIIDLPVIGNFTIPLSRKGQFKLPSLSDVF